MRCVVMDKGPKPNRISYAVSDDGLNCSSKAVVYNGNVCFSVYEVFTDIAPAAFYGGSTRMIMAQFLRKHSQLKGTVIFYGKMLYMSRAMLGQCVRLYFDPKSKTARHLPVQGRGMELYSLLSSPNIEDKIINVKDKDDAAKQPHSLTDIASINIKDGKLLFTKIKESTQDVEKQAPAPKPKWVISPPIPVTNAKPPQPVQEPKAVKVTEQLTTVGSIVSALLSGKKIKLEISIDG